MKSHKAITIPRWTARISGTVFLLFFGVFALADDKPVKYPETRRVEQTDVYHGVEVADPYRWLEEDVRQSEEVAKWITAQNEVTFAYLDSIPEREAIRRRLTELWNYEKYSIPRKRAGHYYISKNDGLQNQWVLYTMDSLDGNAQVLIDPNTWSEDGTIALKGVIIADDGKYLTYGVGEAGSDWGMGRVMEVATRKVLEDELKWVKLSGVSWTKDGKGFFYSRFDAPEPGTEFQSLNLNQKLYYHRVGTSQSEDVLVYARPDQPEWLFFGSVTEDGRYLILTVMKAAGPKVRILYKELNEPYGMPLDLIDNFENLYGFVGNEGPEFYFVTDFEAPKKRLIAIDIRQPQRENWREIIGEVEETLEWVSLVGNMFVTHYLKDAKTLVKIYHMDGEFVREVDFPTIGMAYGFGGRRADTETFYVLTGFATPTSIYRYDMVTGKSRLIWQPKVDFSPEEYETKQVFYHSKDGTRVPMFITHKKGIELNSLNPALLTAYGGFGSSSTPYFQPGNIAWMEIGGVLAVANIRGGGEYGEEWHLAGSALNKQNGFDDFIAAAEWLIENKYTRSEKLAIKGASNGGLLVGAVMTQRPDLFGACLPDVGVMDMLRFHRYTSGRFWVEEYGSSDDPEQFKELLAFSPYHNIKEGTNYPPTLVTTADTDDRVVPAHSFKFAAALQQAQRAEAPVLLRVETRAGHGGGKPTSKQIEEAVDGLAFLVEHLGIELPYQ